MTQPATNEQPAASLTIEQLITELLSRPDFTGAVTWQPDPNSQTWQWRRANCHAGLVFLQMASQILCPPVLAEAPSQS